MDGVGGSRVRVEWNERRRVGGARAWGSLGRGRWISHAACDPRRVIIDDITRHLAQTDADDELEEFIRPSILLRTSIEFLSLQNNYKCSFMK